MAIIVAVRSGNWSDTSHVTGPWPGASTPTTKPGVGDTVQTEEYVITIDEDVTVALLESTSEGYFMVTSAPTLPAVRTITANIFNNGTAGYALRVANPTGKVALAGNMTGGVGDGAHGIYNDGGAIGDVIGNVTGGVGNNAWGIYNTGTMGDIDGSLICSPTCLFPIFGPFRLVANPANAITVIAPDDTTFTLSNDYPAEADVKAGVEYNRGTQTGELAAGGGNIGPVSIVIGGGGIRIS